LDKETAGGLLPHAVVTNLNNIKVFEFKLGTGMETEELINELLVVFF